MYAMPRTGGSGEGDDGAPTSEEVLASPLLRVPPTCPVLTTRPYELTARPYDVSGTDYASQIHFRY